MTTNKILHIAGEAKKAVNNVRNHTFKEGELVCSACAHSLELAIKLLDDIQNETLKDKPSVYCQCAQTKSFLTYEDGSMTCNKPVDFGSRVVIAQQYLSKLINLVKDNHV